jgi:F-type H+-transporting ATPase subunit alpha
VAGDLKLAYAQFEELETFARFGARLDENAIKTIEHGRRIRACLKQTESSPLSVAAQITILLALTNKLFDPVPLAMMAMAESTLIKATQSFPLVLMGKLEAAERLNDEDKQTVLDFARQVLADMPLNQSVLINNEAPHQAQSADTL